MNELESESKLMAEKKTVLVVEDDAAIRRGIVDAMRFAGHATIEAADGDEGVRASIASRCDLVLLDLVLPKRDGLDVLRQIREARPVLPVIILTARGGEDDRVRGLTLGADDYVVKPFSIRELMARVEAVLRRSPARPAALPEVAFEGGIIDFERCEARFQDGTRSALTEREAELARYLASNSGRAVSREELLTRLWGLRAEFVETRTIDMHIARLREKLRDSPADPRIVLTVRGKGYMFAVARIAG